MNVAKLCNAPGCKNITRGASRCEIHQVKKTGYSIRKIYSNDSFYKTAKWTKTARLYRMHNPICEACDKYDILIRADVTDHIIEIDDWKIGAFYYENFMALCHSCHNRKSSLIERGRSTGTLRQTYIKYLTEIGAKSLLKCDYFG